VAKTTNCTNTATAIKTGYATSQGTMQLTVQTTASTGTLQICVEDDKGNPIENAVVTSTAQPTGMGTVTGTTNATGHVAFANALYGTYTLKIIKTPGYLITNQTINFTGQTAPSTVIISNDLSSTPDSNPLLLYIAIIIVIVAVTIVVVVVVIRRRRKIPVSKPPPKFRTHQGPDSKIAFHFQREPSP
jgi:hypothetical protein